MITTTTTHDTIYFDAACGLCSAGERRFTRLLARRGYRLVPLQDPGAVALFGETPMQHNGEMQLRTAGGRTLGGADALVEISRSIWWARPLYVVARVPGAMPVLRAVYRVVARNRMGVSRVCRLEPALNGRKNFSADVSVSAETTDGRTRLPLRHVVFAMAAALPVAAVIAGAYLPAWAFMWLLAWNVYFAFKLVTWRRVADVTRVTTGCTLAYLFASPGMDAGAFLFSGKGASPVISRGLADRRESTGEGPMPLLRAVARVVAGTALLWGVARLIPADLDIARGWVGLVATVLILHFGLVDVLAWFWRTRGIDAQPLMDAPLRSKSLAEFWGRRWNRGFHHLAETFVFNRVAALGPHAALAATFLASGLVHDLVISLPARGGYGLPTLYFLIQAIGVAFERSHFGRRLELRRGLRGRAFTLAILAAPLPMLFHGPFIDRVFIPFMHAIGAL
jgi:alginate O-acetyltransferase complex protein AlgI